MEEKVLSFFRFEDLRVYNKAVDYSNWLFSTLRDARTEGERSMCRSFFNSAMDISINIVEGSSRGKSQFEHYLKVAKSAIRECVIFTTMAKGLNLLTEEESEHSRDLLMELTRMIGALIVSLQKGSRRNRDMEYSAPMSDDADGMADIEGEYDNDSDEIVG